MKYFEFDAPNGLMNHPRSDMLGNSAKWFISQATRSKHAYIFSNLKLLKYDIFSNFIIRKREDQCSLHFQPIFTLALILAIIFLFRSKRETSIYCKLRAHRYVDGEDKEIETPFLQHSLAI